MRLKRRLRQGHLADKLQPRMASPLIVGESQSAGFGVADWWGSVIAWAGGAPWFGSLELELVASRKRTSRPTSLRPWQWRSIPL